jgi:hypothetical protein
MTFVLRAELVGNITNIADSRGPGSNVEPHQVNTGTCALSAPLWQGAGSLPEGGQPGGLQPA